MTTLWTQKRCIQLHSILGSKDKLGGIIILSCRFLQTVFMSFFLKIIRNQNSVDNLEGTSGSQQIITESTDWLSFKASSKGGVEGEIPLTRRSLLMWWQMNPTGFSFIYNLRQNLLHMVCGWSDFILQYGREISHRWWNLTGLPFFLLNSLFSWFILLIRRCVIVMGPLTHCPSFQM